MTDPSFQQELNLIHELAAEFASANPALAPLLGRRQADPDVERLLDAVAYQNALLRRKLDRDFPELVKTLVRLLLPHYLRPVPATTMMAFTPDPMQRRTVTVPAGSRFASTPVAGTSCPFATTSDVDVHPLELRDATFSRRPSGGGEISLTLELAGLPLSDWHPMGLRFFLCGDYPTATELFQLLARDVGRVVLASLDGGSSVALSPDCLTSPGFSDAEAVLPYPANALPRYRLLQEYFNMPERFLFVDVQGWERWRQRGNGTRFTITFELANRTKAPRIGRENFALHVVPAANLFPHDAEPVLVTHRMSRYPIRTPGLSSYQCRIFSVDRVTGYTRATGQVRDYLPFELFRGGHGTAPLYHAEGGGSFGDTGYGVGLCLSFPGGLPSPGAESLSIALTCTNGALPDDLRIGDVTQPLTPLPDRVSARNITAVNPAKDPPKGESLLRRLISHLYLDHLSLARAGHLRALLELYVFTGFEDGSRAAANLRRIAGIEAVEVTAGERLVEGTVMRGRDIRVRVRQDHFAGRGDLYLFGCLLDEFFGRHAAVNCFTRVEMIESVTGVHWQWPARQ